MDNKSKFTAFIFSFIPGLSHLYLGFTKRAMAFFALFCSAIAGIAGIASILNEGNILAILPFVLILIWFLALTDAMSLVDKLRTLKAGGNGRTANTESIEEFFANNRKMITVALSLVPGAGHMYLGYLKEGVLLMAVFFFTIFLMSWLNMGLFLFILPVVWFYSLFDALHRVEGKSEKQWEEESFLIRWWDSHPQCVGWTLIIIGCLVILERIISPTLAKFLQMSEFGYYLQTGIVAIVLIAGGIKLLIGTRVDSGDMQTESGPQSDDERKKVESCGSGE